MRSLEEQTANLMVAAKSFPLTSQVWEREIKTKNKTVKTATKLRSSVMKEYYFIIQFIQFYYRATTQLTLALLLQSSLTPTVSAQITMYAAMSLLLLFYPNVALFLHFVSFLSKIK